MERKIVVYPGIPLDMINSINREYEKDFRKKGEDLDGLQGMNKTLIIYGIAGDAYNDGYEIAVYQTKTQRIFRQATS